MTSPTQWTWVCVDSGSWWWTGMPGVLRFMGSQRVRHNWATELNWTELKSISPLLIYICVCVCVCVCVCIYFFNNSVMSLSGIVSSNEKTLCKQGKWRISAPKLLPLHPWLFVKDFPRQMRISLWCLKSFVNLSRVINPIAQTVYWICKNDGAFHRPFSARMKYSVL